MGKLVFLIQGPKRAARLTLEGPFFVVGRGEPFPIFQDDPSLSREHVAVVDTPDGYVVKDLGSPNGVLVNGEQLERYAEVPFAPGDLLQAGETRIRLVEVCEAELEGEEPIVVDREGRTGLYPVPVQEQEDEDIGGETTTSEMERPGPGTEEAVDGNEVLTASSPDEDLEEELEVLEEEGPEEGESAADEPAEDAPQLELEG